MQNRNENGLDISRGEQTRNWEVTNDARSYWANRNVSQNVSERLIKHLNETLQKKSNILIILRVYHVLLGTTFRLNIIV